MIPTFALLRHLILRFAELVVRADVQDVDEHLSHCKKVQKKVSCCQCIFRADRIYLARPGDITCSLFIRCLHLKCINLIHGQAFMAAKLKINKCFYPICGHAQDIKITQLMLRANNKKQFRCKHLPFSPTKGSDQVNTSMKLGSQ